MATDPAPEHTILICTKCRGVEAAAAMRGALTEDLPLGFGFRAVNCMAGCDHPIAVGLQAHGKATYLFGPIDDDDAVAAIGEFAHQYQQSGDGWTSATDRPAALYEKTLARLPGLRFDAQGKGEAL
ncbi:MAG: DUF1636 family protein [Pseudomonadota bacterium]